MTDIVYAFFAASLELVMMVLDLYIWVLVIGAILSWLTGFGILNSYNRFVQVSRDMIYRLTEPLLRRVRRYVPPINGIDLSPIVVIFAILFLESFIRHLLTGL